MVVGQATVVFVVVVAPITVVMAPRFIFVARALALILVPTVMDFLSLLILKEVLCFPILDIFNVRYAIATNTLPLTLSITSIWRMRTVFLHKVFRLMKLLLLIPCLPNAHAFQNRLFDSGADTYITNDLAQVSNQRTYNGIDHVCLYHT